MYITAKAKYIMYYPMQIFQHPSVESNKTAAVEPVLVDVKQWCIKFYNFLQGGGAKQLLRLSRLMKLPFALMSILFSPNPTKHSFYLKITCKYPNN